jgi:hypothetical protein
MARERTDLEREDCRRLGVHTARDPRLDERARPAREVVERGRPDPPGHRRQRRRLPPGQTGAARTHDRRRLHTHPVDLPATAAWSPDGPLTLPGTGSISAPQPAGREGTRWTAGAGWRAGGRVDSCSGRRRGLAGAGRGGRGRVDRGTRRDGGWGGGGLVSSLPAAPPALDRTDTGGLPPRFLDFLLLASLLFRFRW